MAVLIYFVHYIHGSTDLIFRTLYPWLYEVFSQTGLQVQILDTQNYQLFLHERQLVNEMQGGKDEMKIKLYRMKNTKETKKSFMK